MKDAYIKSATFIRRITYLSTYRDPVQEQLPLQQLSPCLAIL